MNDDGRRWTWPPTTATEGSASHRVGREAAPSPWSPRTVQARWMRFTSTMTFPMVAISADSGWELGGGGRSFVLERSGAGGSRRKRKCEREGETAVPCVSEVWTKQARRRCRDGIGLGLVLCGFVTASLFRIPLPVLPLAIF